MAYPAFHYPPGYAQFTAQVFQYKHMLDTGKARPVEATQYPVAEYVRQYGADTVKAWIATYCEMGTPHENVALYTSVIASIQRYLNRFDHAARSEKERLATDTRPTARG